MPPKKKAKEGKQQVNVAQSVSSKGGKTAPKGLSSEAEAAVHSSSCPSSSNATRVSVESIASSPITALANEYWSVPHDGSDSSNFQEDLVKGLYNDVLCSNDYTKCQLLELSGYLENYLWPFYSLAASSVHTLSVLLIVHEKLMQDSSAFESLSVDEEKLNALMCKLVDMFMTDSLPAPLAPTFLRFLLGAFRNGEHEAVKRNTLRFVSLPIWTHLSRTRLRREVSMSEALASNWKKFSEQQQTLASKLNPEAASSSSSKGKRKRDAEPAVDLKLREVHDSMRRDADFMPFVIDRILRSMQSDEQSDVQSMCLEHMLELLVELLLQWNTRRYLTILLDDLHFLLRCKTSPLMQSQLPGNKKAQKLLDMVEDYLHFEVDDITCAPLSKQDIMERCNARISQLQQLAFAEFPEKLRGLVFSSMGELSKRAELARHFALFSKSELLLLARKLALFHDKDEQLYGHNGETVDEDFLKELIFEYVAVRQLLVERINKLPLYPTEAMLWDEDFLPSSSSFDKSALALPKLNLQFLTLYDYFMRNFVLFLMESAHEIRGDLMDAVKRMGPRQLPMMHKVSFAGWARMALPITSVTVDEVAKPMLGEIIPRTVDCTVTVDLARFTGEIRQEWEDLREHDVLFLICVENPTIDLSAALSDFEKDKQLGSKGKKTKKMAAVTDDEMKNFANLYGIKYIRGGVVFQHRDEANNILNDVSKSEGATVNRVGSHRQLRLHLDPGQYYSDVQQGLNCYESFNLLVRRNAKENNFKAVLQTIRDLLNSASIGAVIPHWLADVLLGVGSPASAHFRSLKKIDTKVAQGLTVQEEFDFNDTFLNAQHIIEAFPSAQSVHVDPNALGPYQLQIDHVPVGAAKKSAKQAVTSLASEVVHAKSISRAPRGPYAEDLVPRNPIRFTAAQVQAIRSGMNEGLALIIGPPGTGKTDCAVQIISNLYHNFPTQKILIVTHSNAALNDIFEKIMQRDIDPRHLLRLGSGEAELRDNLTANQRSAAESTFSKQGRVQWCLIRRLQLLAQVQRLAASLQVVGDFGSNCETSLYFHKIHLQPRIDTFYAQIKADRAEDTVGKCFPFSAFFADAPQPLFRGDRSADEQAAEGCFNHLRRIFAELTDYRAFELLRTQALRTDYLLTKQARIVAMTCTHAAMTRARLVELGFKYDSVVIEEAAQILEVETMIPMLLQDSDPVTSSSRLKRVVLLGDAQQLPPVIQHQVLAKACRLEQSLFSRLLRLGAPSVTLDQQGRARPEIAALYAWKYTFPEGDGRRELGNMPAVLQQADYLHGNAGFVHSFQIIDVPPFNGKGESCPTPFFYQNLGEAEYVVAVFQYMRLLGYPASKISILTTYNGQKQLIQDILQQRCKSALFGMPAQVATVDKYQGQQNDIVLLSLVRTEAVGHIRDLRRLIVALSRARLGLYVFGRLSLFENCFELMPALARLKQNPTSLELVAGEAFPCVRPVSAPLPAASVLQVADVTAMGILVYQMVQQAQQLASTA